ncbi:MAG: BlaI/MecI/CopY family transcriptional regulator [Bacillota bacterium]
MVAENNSLGPLEADIMQVIWKIQKATVQDVYDELSQDRTIAYNTVMTVMTRLAQKGVLKRQKDGRAYVYFPKTTKNEVGKGMLQYVIDKIFGGSRAPVISQLLDETELSEEELNVLKRLVEQKKSEG